MSVGPIPPIPEARGYESTGEAKLMPRYEDIAQDGSVQLPSLMVGLTAVWRTLTKGERLQSLMHQGILPILNRIVMEGEPGPFSVHTPIHVEGTWRLSRERGGERLFLDMWLDAHAAHAHTLGPQPDADAARVRVGRIYAEHVITRPFASTPAERKVTRLDIPGIPSLPDLEHPYEDAPSLVSGHDLEPLREHRFAMRDTDSNQHVNSLVYPRLFEEAVTTRAMDAAAPAHAERLLARAIELRYRKPFFTGERATIAGAMRATEVGLEAVGAFVLADADPSKPSATVAMTFR